MTLNLHLPDAEESLKPTITVVGVGGAGGNAVNNMIVSELAGVGFVVANTDAQALEQSLSGHKVQLGGNITQGLGAGANPKLGEAAAEEVAEELARHIEGSHMVFITAGMGGGTGTGAAPVVAKIARDLGILTVAVVTKPFQFEGTHRMKLADAGLQELQQYVDTLIIIPNQNLFRIANERTTFADAFKLADEVLHSGVRGVTDLMVKPGLINLDFADIRAVMQEMGKAMMGTGEASGERRAIEAAEAAISNPLLDDVSLKGARSLLINITGGMDMTLFEVDEAANRIRQEVDPDANIIFGSAFNEEMEGIMRVSVVATGIEANQQTLELDNTGAGDVQKKKPYLFAQHAKPEPVKVNPRTAQDVMREAPRVVQSAPVSQPQPAPQPIANPKVEQAANDLAREAVDQKQERDDTVEQLPQEKPVARPINSPAEPVAEKASEVETVDFNISPRDSYDHREMPNTRGLFQRIADVSKVLATRPEEELEQEEPKKASTTTRTQVKEHKREKAQTASLFDDNEEYIDIPAFLRRQSN